MDTPVCKLPERRVFTYITRAIHKSTDAQAYINDMTQATAQGFTMERCGINGTGAEIPLAWAILSKPERED